ncbi:S-layer homology domain-containing protein [Brevibacillus sp. IT-7CA2]|uniref:S-layer homology domain-containing protein n=1 Tax=Brevibacillus sp. IT-7CA2 TaxID=3026436 RepID=UPI0039E1B603
MKKLILSFITFAMMILPGQAFADQKEVVKVPKSTTQYKIKDKDGNYVVLDFDFQPEEVTVVVTVPNTPDNKIIKIPTKKNSGGSKGNGGGGGVSGGSAQKPGSTNDSIVAFPDTTNHWAKTDIQMMVMLGLFKGYPDGTFKPDKEITKAEFAAVLVRAIQMFDKEFDVGNHGSKLQDVKPNEWFYSYVRFLEARQNIDESIYPKYLMYPNKPIYREEVAYWLSKEVRKKDVKETKVIFKDQDKLLYKDEVMKVTGAELLKGFPDGSFGPFKSTTRGQAASIILRLLKLKGVIEGGE